MDTSHTLNSVSLLNLYEHKLHSAKQYKEVIQRMQEEYPDLHQYAKLNTLLCFGDQPTFAMLRKLRAQGQISIRLISRLVLFIFVQIGIYL